MSQVKLRLLAILFSFLLVLLFIAACEGEDESYDPCDEAQSANVQPATGPGTTSSGASSAASSGARSGSTSSGSSANSGSKAPPAVSSSSTASSSGSATSSRSTGNAPKPSVASNQKTVSTGAAKDYPQGSFKGGYASTRGTLIGGYGNNTAANLHPGRVGNNDVLYGYSDNGQLPPSGAYRMSGPPPYASSWGWTPSNSLLWWYVLDDGKTHCPSHEKPKPTPTPNPSQAPSPTSTIFS